MSTGDLGSAGATAASRAGPRGGRYTAATGWTGWIAFASTMLCLVGGFHVVQGLVGIFRDGYFVVPKDDLLVKVDYSVWGWLHLGLGVLAIAVGVGMIWGRTWARVIGVIFAVISILVNLAFLNAYPVWSVMVIAFDVLVIWALTVHGEDMQAQGDQASWAD